MVTPDILAEIRLRADGLRALVDLPGLGFFLGITLVLLIAFALWPIDVPDEAGPPLTRALVDAAVWGAP